MRVLARRSRFPLEREPSRGKSMKFSALVTLLFMVPLSLHAGGSSSVGAPQRPAPMPHPMPPKPGGGQPPRPIPRPSARALLEKRVRTGCMEGVAECSVTTCRLFEDRILTTYVVEGVGTTRVARIKLDGVDLLRQQIRAAEGGALSKPEVTDAATQVSYLAHPDTNREDRDIVLQLSGRVSETNDASTAAGLIQIIDLNCR